MIPETSKGLSAPPFGGFSRLWVVAYGIILVFVAVLAVETALRVRFPWDFYFWSESPFLTNMMKLNQHEPIYSTPADGNSFVYSPGEEYLCYAALKPLGLELDIRYCRLVSVSFGVLAAAFGALAIMRFACGAVGPGRTKVYFLATWGLLWLVLSKNFMADIVHPDNLHALHATLILWLCLMALDGKQFSVALVTMVVAGIGVFTKQTEALSFLGPLAAFAIYNPWGWRRWLLLALGGAATVGVSLRLLWSSPDAKFWTFDVLRHQGIVLSKAYLFAMESLSMDRALLFFLGVIAVVGLWRAGNAARRYLVIWGCVGFFCVVPNLTAYLKAMGAWNNLILLEIWLAMIVWPFFGMFVDWPASSGNAKGGVTVSGMEALRTPICALTVLLLCLLVPIKAPPSRDDYAFCRKLEEAVRADVQAGHRVLLAHTTEVLIHSGVKEAPRDRCNSLLEMRVAGLDGLSEMKSRINARYYDRIYLLRGDWYGSDVHEAINRNYTTDYVITKVPYKFDYKYRLVYGYGQGLEDCPVLSPRPQK